MSDIVNVPMAAQRDIQTVTAEIRQLHRQAQCMVLGYAIEIGRKLVEAKAMLPYGQWGQWLKEEVEFSQSSAQNFMRIFEEYGAKQVSLFGDAESQTLGNLPYTHALKLLALPAEEREEFAQEHHVEDISSRELEKLLRERDEAQADAKSAKDALDEAAKIAEKADEARRDAEAAAERIAKELQEARGEASNAKGLLERAKKDAETARKSAEESRAALKELREKPEVPQDVMEEMRRRIEKDAAEQAAANMEETKRQAAKELEKAESRAALAVAQVENLQKRLSAADPDTAVFRTWFTAVQEDFRRLEEAAGRVSEKDPEKGGKLAGGRPCAAGAAAGGVGMRCKDCPDYQECVRRYDLRTYRRRCIKAKKGAKLAGTASGDLSLPELLQAIRRLKVETGSLACLGCGYEHDCGIHGCAILRAAEWRLDSSDVAPVVRCRECIHHVDYCGYLICGRATAPNEGVIVKPDFFCASGRRKEDDHAET